MNLRYLVFCLATTLFASSLVAQDKSSSRHEEGLQKNSPNSYVLRGATVVTRPGTKIDNASIVVRDGRIVSVGTEGNVPADHRVVDVSGKTIYAGLIDAYSEQEIEISGTDDASDHTRYWNANIRPERKMAEMFRWKEDAAKSLKENGFTSVLVAPTSGIFRGQAALLLVDSENAERAILNPAVAQAAMLTTQRRFGGPRIYPSSPMGAVALARQSLFDAQWYNQAWQVARQQPKLNRPETNLSLQALQSVLSGQQPLMAKASNELMALRADRFAKEFNTKLVIVGSGNEYRRLDDIAAMKRTFVLPVDFPAPPNVSTHEDAMNVSLESLMDWDIAPENPARMAGAGVSFAFTSNGLKNKSEFLKRVRQAVARGLNADVALAALTTTPAAMFGVDSQIGSIEPGKLANFIVTDGDLFEEKTKIVETWVAGDRLEIKKQPSRSVEGSWQIATGDLSIEMKLTDKDGTVDGKLVLPKSVDAESDKAKDEPQDSDSGSEQDDSDAESDDTKKEEDKEASIKLKKLALIGSRLSGSFKADELGPEGTAQFTLIVDSANEAAQGFVVWPDGSRLPLSATKNAVVEAEEGEDSKEDPKANNDDEEKGEGKTDAKFSKQPASYAVNYPLGAYGVDKPADPETVLFDNLTVWTCGDKGVMKNAAVLIRDGKIVSVVGDGVPRPTATTTIDCSGFHLTPGIIDCHSHFATDSGVNEGSQAITSEVRIGDFIDCDDITIYRQLAGGVTSSNILHGSANPIGGQNQVVKLRWGMGDEAFKMTEAPGGIKFALGENVKRSRSAGSRRPDEPPPRYPTTRMGVEQLMHDTFRSALQYKQARESWNANPVGLPPRRDLELDAIVEIIDGKRWIHCHSYRQDEILALIRVLDEYKITIGTFQHILEGYKVADKMAEHGAMASAFADWWAYKFEVYDAIPYAGKLMHDAGVVVSFNSDDGELATHLNQEAAKAVKYGGVSEEEALKFVTLNPAKQLRIDQFVGSIEVGKHADLALWSGPPLSAYSRCLQTWVDGRKYFDVDDDSARRVAVVDMRQVLIQKILNSGEKMRSKDGRTDDPQNMWPRYDEFCGAHIHTNEDSQELQQLSDAWKEEEE